MKKLRLRQEVKNFLGFLVFSLIMVLGIIVLNARFESLNECMNEGNTREYCVEVGR